VHNVIILKIIIIITISNYKCRKMEQTKKRKLLKGSTDNLKEIKKCKKIYHDISKK